MDPTVYRLGDSGPAVASVRSTLVGLGLLAAPAEGSAATDDAFDAATERAVRAFQQQRGLSVDGRVGDETFRALESARYRLGDRLLHHQVSRPLRGDDVAALQERLLQLGFDAGRSDGIFGPRTEAALADFQRNTGLTSDGACGPATLRALDQLRRSVVGGRPHEMRAHEALRRRGPTLAGKSVVVDPGHGGISASGAIDHGWVVGDLSERMLMSDLAARLEGRLAAAGAYAFLTHGGPEATRATLSEEDRAAFANETDADLLISLHCDGSASDRANGVATYYYGSGRDSASVVGEHFAELVQREVVARTDLVDLRTHPKTWDLLRTTQMPAVRVELGYLTSPSDRTRLASPDFRDTVAEALLVAIQRLFLPPGQDPATGALRLDDIARYV